MKINQSEFITDRFQFIFYMSFLNEKQSIGLKLCRQLEDFCARHKIPDFKLVIRFSEQDKTRWSADYIRKQLN